MSGVENVPEWAVKRAFDLSNEAGANWSSVDRMLEGCTGYAFACYIAEHEDEPVDPLLLEARKLVADRYNPEYGMESIEATLRGEDDETEAVRNALKALRRGIELAQVQQ